MSEFSESYHLVSAEQQDGVALLKRAGLSGFVFPPEQGWVTLLAEGSLFQPNRELISANEGTLLHYINAEDHGWSFMLYRAAQPISGFSSDWESDEPFDDSNLDAGAVCDAARQATGAERDPADLQALLMPEDLFENLGERYAADAMPSSEFAQFVGLTNYEWVSYDYFSRDNEDGDAEVEGVIVVE